MKCIKCKFNIQPHERYLHIEEKENDNLIREEFWHKKCFDDRALIKRLALGLVGRTNKLLDKAEDRLGEGKEVYVVK